MTDSMATGRDFSLSYGASRAVDAWWRASYYLSVGQRYLPDKPLLREALRVDRFKRRSARPAVVRPVTRTVSQTSAYSYGERGELE